MEGTTPECGPPEGRRLRCKVPVRICALGNENAKREPEIQFGVQRGGIKLAFPDALTEAHLRRTERPLSMRKATHAA